ncbi:MAG: hypothetical protein QOC92_3234 [Acidimicrobiaceae bacterium]
MLAAEGPAPGGAAPWPTPASSLASRFFRSLGLIACAGFCLRLAYVGAVRPHDLLVAPDAINFHDGANLLAQGHGFIDPYALRDQAIAVPTAEHPPAYLLYLAAFSALGFSSLFAHMIASTFLGVATILMVGLVGRELGGPRVGLLAAGIAAFYPGLVVIDGMIQGESMAVLAVTALVYFALRYRSRPTPRAAAGLGALVGWAGMTRSEQFLLGLLVVVPVIARTAVEARERALQMAAALVACLVLVLPWVIFNATRFDGSVFLTTNFEYTIAATNCQDTWYGTRIGFWSADCSVQALASAGMTLQDGDQTQRAVVFRRAGFAYVRDHLGRLPVVMTARVLRMLNVWDPPEQIRLDHDIEGREYWMSAASVIGFFVLAPFALAGAIRLRRAHRLRAELIGPPLVVLISAVFFMGNSRYRSPAEGLLCVFAAIAVQVVLARNGRARVTRTAAPQAEQDRPSLADRGVGQ